MIYAVRFTKVEGNRKNERLAPLVSHEIAVYLSRCRLAFCRQAFEQYIRRRPVPATLVIQGKTTRQAAHW
jgi:hypothetical protein